LVDDRSSLADGAPSPVPTWVTSLGGPLIVVPASALADWHGSTGPGLVVADGEVPDDYDRACAIDGLAGTLAVGERGSRGLVLADEPAMTCYLPERRAFVRWLAAGSEADLFHAADAVLADPATVWEECGEWETDGAAVLMDSVNAGSELGIPYPGGGRPEHALISIPAAVWRVRAAYPWADENTWVGLVQLTSPQ
jgi:Immunity protein 21